MKNKRIGIIIKHFEVLIINRNISIGISQRLIQIKYGWNSKTLVVKVKIL